MDVCVLLRGCAILLQLNGGSCFRLIIFSWSVQRRERDLRKEKEGGREEGRGGISFFLREML